MPRMTRTIISLPEEEKNWIDAYSKRHRVSSAEVIRRALREFREGRTARSLKSVLEETAGTWTTIKGDSRAHVDRLRKDWERRS
jgi:Arc/MetJ-type ribon-helix-helix transcriptional regulator